MKNKITKNQQNNEQFADILYQKLGQDWYAFTEVKGEVYMAKVSEEEIHARREEQEEFFLNAISDDAHSHEPNPKNIKAA